MFQRRRAIRQADDLHRLVKTVIINKIHTSGKVVLYSIPCQKRLVHESPRIVRMLFPVPDGRLF